MKAEKKKGNQAANQKLLNILFWKTD